MEIKKSWPVVQNQDGLHSTPAVGMMDEIQMKCGFKEQYYIILNISLCIFSSECPHV